MSEEEPQDITPAEAETQPPSSIELEWQGYTLQIAATPGQMHPRVLRAFELGSTIDVVEGVVGIGTFNQLMDDPTMTVDRLRDLMERVATLWGFEGAGESKASS